MKSSFLYPAWAGLYILCVCFGAISERSTTGQVMLNLTSLVFFVPPAIMLAQAVKAEDKKTLKTLRLISGLSLGLTMLALVGNILSVLAPRLLGDILYVVLLLVSAPMLCCQYWAFTLLLWAVLFFSTFPKTWKKAK